MSALVSRVIPRIILNASPHPICRARATRADPSRSGPESAGAAGPRTKFAGRALLSVISLYHDSCNSKVTFQLDARARSGRLLVQYASILGTVPH